MNIFKPTALYGKSFKATDQSDVYALRVYTGGFAGVKTATSRLIAEANQFIGESDYSSFQILKSERVWLPFSCVEFLVSFNMNRDKNSAEQAAPSNR
jgi:hypothetical protein